MLKRLLAFLIFLALSAPSAVASTDCPATSSSDYLDLEISALYPNPNTGEAEWIELSNTGGQSTDLSLYTLEDSTANPWAPSGTLESGEQLQLTGFSFQLNNSDETVTLKTSDGTVIDSWSYTSSTKGEILYRNGTSTEVATSTETTTTATTVAATPSLWPSFSEALPNPSGSDSEAEWIELYNPYEDTLTLDGLQVDDEDGGSSPYALTGTLAPESYLLITVTDSGITLNNTEDHVRLLGVNNEVLWDVPYTDVTEGYSYASLDGSTFWTDEPTPGEENIWPTVEVSTEENSETDESSYGNGTLSEEVEVTEVYPNPEGSDTEEEWIEITNGGNTEVNLGNWTITDASGSSYTFPNDTILQPGDTLVLYRTESGISLNNSNESIELADYTGEVISEVSYDSSEEDESYAEIEVEEVSSVQASSSGLGNPSFSTWQWVSPSPGVKNPVWKQIKGTVSEWDGQWLTLFDGLSNWTFQTDGSSENSLLYQVGNSVLIQATMESGVYQIMHSELLSSAAPGGTGGFPWGWTLTGLAIISWGTYELYKKRKKVWNLEAQALN